MSRLLSNKRIVESSIEHVIRNERISDTEVVAARELLSLDTRRADVIAFLMSMSVVVHLILQGDPRIERAWLEKFTDYAADDFDQLWLLACEWIKCAMAMCSMSAMYRHIPFNLFVDSCVTCDGDDQARIICAMTGVEFELAKGLTSLRRDFYSRTPFVFEKFTSDDEHGA